MYLLMPYQYSVVDVDSENKPSGGNDFTARGGRPPAYRALMNEMILARPPFNKRCLIGHNADAFTCFSILSI